MHFFKILSKRHIAFLWVSQVLSAMGDYFYSIAVIWIAVKTVGSGAGIVAAAEAASTLVFGLLGGVFADRWDRRKVMVTVDIIRAGTVALLPILEYFGVLQLWHLTVVAVVIGGLEALFDPALQASLPALAGDTQTLQAMNGLMDVTSRLARTLGPSLAGVLVAFMPLPQFFTLDAVSFVISALAILSLGRRFIWKPAESSTPNKGVLAVPHEIAGAIGLLKAHRPLAWAIIANAINNILWSIAFVIGVPILVDRVLVGNVGAYGLIIGAYGVGNVLSNFVIGSLPLRNRVSMVFSGLIVLGAGFLLLALATTLPMALLGAAFAAIGGPMGDIIIATMIQTEFPANQIGKIYSLRMVTASVGGSLGLVLAVPLFAHFSVMYTIGACACAMIAMGIIGVMRYGLSAPQSAPDATELPEVTP
ncbi:MAG TPA: MFS transporter [Ktedonobacteraceae bacterium]|nr:MFS transporter [Ktedonobacteraceae bacterium]